MALTATITLTAQGKHTGTADLGTPTMAFNLAAEAALANGTGANQADRVFSDQRTLAASASEDLDLAAVLADAFGATITMAKVKGIIIKAAAGNTNDVVFSRPAANGVPLFGAASGSLPIRPGGFFAWVAPGTGVTVTAGTGDLITVTNGGAGTSVTYDIVIIGTSA